MGSSKSRAASRLTNRGDKEPWLLLVAILAISLFLRLSFLHEPFERDEGAYAYMAQEILRGSVPYKDVIDIKPPAIYYAYAAIMALFGETAEAIRMFTAFYSLLTVCAVFLVTRQVSERKAGLVAALLYGVFSSAPSLHGSSSNSEVFLVLPSTLGIYFLLRAVHEADRRSIFLCGVSCAAAMLVKTVAIPIAALAAIGILSLPRSGHAVREKILDFAALISGPVALASLAVGYFFLNGALHDFLYWNVTFALQYSSTEVGGPPFFWAAYMLLPELLPLVLVALPTFVRLLFNSRGYKEHMVALFLPAGLIGVILPGKNFPHYFIQLIPPLAILAGIEITRLFTTKGWRFYVGLVLLAALFSFPVYMRYPYYLVYTPDQVSTRKYGPLFVESKAVARYLKDRTSPSDYIFQWGFEMELYYLASRRSPLPFIASLFVGWSKDPAAAIHRMVEEINKKKPKYILVQKQWANVPGVTELMEILARDYFLEATVAYAQIYRRYDESEFRRCEACKRERVAILE